MQTFQMPAMPAPAHITLNSKTTALMMLDYVEHISAIQPKIRNLILPPMVPFMQRVRNAGLVVAYGTREQNMTHWLKEVAPVDGDIKIVSSAQDRFYNTDLDNLLKAKSITTLIMVGWKISGSITYTSVGAMIRDYTVVVPVDTTTATTDYETAIGFYNVLNSGNANLTNECPHRSIPISHSDRSRSTFPGDPDQAFRLIPIRRSSRSRSVCGECGEA